MSQPQTTDDRDDLTNLARQILRDRYRVDAFYNSAFTVHDWINAAEYALEGDFDDLRYYVAEDDRCDADQRADYMADYVSDCRRDDRMVAQWEASL